MSIDQVTAEAMALPPEERLMLAHALFDSVPEQEEKDDWEPDPKDVQVWLRRAEELESGKVVGLSWEEVLAKAERELECD